MRACVVVIQTVFFLLLRKQRLFKCFLRVPRQTTRKEIIKRVAVAVQRVLGVSYWFSCLFNNIKVIVCMRLKI